MTKRLWYIPGTFPFGLGGLGRRWHSFEVITTGGTEDAAEVMCLRRGGSIVESMSGMKIASPMGGRLGSSCKWYEDCSLSQWCQRAETPGTKEHSQYRQEIRICSVRQRQIGGNFTDLKHICQTHHLREYRNPTNQSSRSFRIAQHHLILTSLTSNHPTEKSNPSVPSKDSCHTVETPESWKDEYEK